MVRYFTGLVVASIALTGCQQTKVGSKAANSTANGYAAPAPNPAIPAPGPGIQVPPPGVNVPPPVPQGPPPVYNPPPVPPQQPPVYPPVNPPVNPPVYPPAQPPVTPTTPVVPTTPVTPTVPPTTYYPPVNPPINPTNETVPVNPVPQTPVTPVFQPPSIRDPQVIVPPPPAPTPGPGEQVFQPPVPTTPVPVPVNPQPQSPPLPYPQQPQQPAQPVPLPPQRPPNLGQSEPKPEKPVPLPPPRPPELAPKPEPKQPEAGQCGPVNLDAKEKVEEAKLDVLFVVDTSASLRVGDKNNTAGELAQIASQMPNFVSAFPSKTDIRIAVMLGHGSTNHTGRLFSAGKGDPAVLKVSDFGNDRARIGRLLEDKMKKVPNESGGAQGEALMYSLYQSINKANLRAEITKQDFYRKDAALAVIFVTDEQDVCFDYKGSGFTPVGKVRKDKKGNVISTVDPVEEKFFKEVCSKAGPGRTLLTPGVTMSALRAQKQNEKIMLFGLVYSTQESVPKAGREDENEMGHGIIELVGLQDSPNGKIADLGAVQEGPTKFGPELAFFANLAKNELESNGKIQCQPSDFEVMNIDSRTVKAELLNDKGQTIGVFSQDCTGKSCGDTQGGLSVQMRSNSSSKGFLQVTLEQKALNKLLNAHNSKANQVKLTYMSRGDEAPNAPAKKKKK